MAWEWPASSHSGQLSAMPPSLGGHTAMWLPPVGRAAEEKGTGWLLNHGPLCLPPGLQVHAGKCLSPREGYRLGAFEAEVAPLLWSWAQRRHCVPTEGSCRFRGDRLLPGAWTVTEWGLNAGGGRVQPSGHEGALGYIPPFI